MTSTAPYLIEELEVELHIGGKQVAVAFEREVPVIVEFSYQPGYPAHITADPFYSEPGQGSEIDIHSVKPTLQAFINVTDEDEAVIGTLVFDAGRCLLSILPEAEIQRIETMIDKYMEEGEEL